MEDKNKLMNDLLQEAAPADFRAELLAETLGHVRRRKTEQRRNRTLLSVACVIAISFAFLRITLPESIPLTVQVPAAIDPLIVHSQPMPSSMIVTTDPQSVPIVLGTPDTLAIVETSSHEILFKTIGDDELLTLLAGRPAVLVRPRKGIAELHFANPDDSTELFLP